MLAPFLLLGPLAALFRLLFLALLLGFNASTEVRVARPALALFVGALTARHTLARFLLEVPAVHKACFELLVKLALAATRLARGLISSCASELIVFGRLRRGREIDDSDQARWRRRMTASGG